MRQGVDLNRGNLPWLPGILGGVIGLILLVLAALSPPNLLSAAQERAFDALLPMTLPRVSVPTLSSNLPRATPLEVHVVEIARTGAEGGPWGRADLAALINKLSEARPVVLGIDILIAGNCEATPESGTLRLYQSIQRATERGTTVIPGFLLADEPMPVALPGVDIPRMAVMEDAPAWTSIGADLPCLPILDITKGEMGLIAVAGDLTGRVSSLPAAVFAAGHPFPALSVGVVRAALGISASVLGRSADGQGWLRLGSRTLHLSAKGEFRFAATSPASRAELTHSASDILTGKIALPQGAIVLIGSALPESGGLRASRIGPLHPTVHFHADAIEQILAETLPVRQSNGPQLEAAVTLIAGISLIALCLRLSPAVGFVTALLFAVTWLAACAYAAQDKGILLDPVIPISAMALAAGSAILSAAVRNRMTARRLGARMRKHLPAAMVSRLSGGDDVPRFAGEMREVTALFTDIAGFSSMTRRVAPEDLIALLDQYMTQVTELVERHGGMVDKIVGDAVHALFNAPETLEGHVDHALACAIDIQTATEALRAGDLFRSASFGHTRIGIETGMAILGDVGHGTRFDYTAHGDAVNMAARLQEANKELGSRILIGPRASELATSPTIVGPEIDLRSFGRLKVSFLPGYEPGQT